MGFKLTTEGEFRLSGQCLSLVICFIKSSDYGTFYLDISEPLIICRHETPVLSKPIDIVHLSEDLVVLDKPCSLPVSSTDPLTCVATSHFDQLKSAADVTKRTEK